MLYAKEERRPAPVLIEDLMLEHDNYELKLGLIMFERLTVTASGYVASLVNDEDRPIH